MSSIDDATGALSRPPLEGRYAELIGETPGRVRLPTTSIGGAATALGPDGVLYAVDPAWLARLIAAREHAQRAVDALVRGEGAL